jgi:hypothetical protein
MTTKERDLLLYFLFDQKKSDLKTPGTLAQSSGL